MKECTNSTILTCLKSHVTGTSFAIPDTSQERNVAAKFQLDRPSGLAGEVEIGDGRMKGQTDGRCMMTIPYLEFKFKISNNNP